MNKGKYRALDNIYVFSSTYEEDIYIPEEDVKLYILIRKGEIIDYQGGCGRIIRGDEPIDIDFEDIYKALPYIFEFLGEEVKDE